MFDGGEVDAFVESPGGGAAVADRGHSDHAGFAAQAAGIEPAGDHGHEGTEVADHGVVTFAGTSAVDVAIAPAHGTLGRSEIRAEGVEHGVPEGETSGLVADERTENVALLEKDG